MPLALAADRRLPSLDRGPVDLSAFDLLAINFETLIFKGVLNLHLQLLDLKL